MGCEDFVVRITSEIGCDALKSTLATMPGVHQDERLGRTYGESYWRYEDPDHIIEVEVAPSHHGSTT